MTISRRDRSNLVAMTVANAFALAAAVAAYLIFSRMLSVEAFAVYSMSLALSKALSSYFDVCLRTTLIRSSVGLHSEHRRAILRRSYSRIFGPTILILLLALSLAWRINVVSLSDAIFAAAMVISMASLAPIIAVNTAVLESRQRYQIVGVLESAAIVAEYGIVAVLFFLSSGLGLYVFALGVLMGRVFRALAFSCALKRAEGLEYVENEHARPSNFNAVTAETNWQFAGMLSAYIRDNLPALIIAPFFGKIWAGSYIWTLQLTGLATQAFVASVSRLLIPQYGEQADFSDRWKITLNRVHGLTALVLLICFALLIYAPLINATFFQGKWELAIGLLPFFLLRMVWGVATSVIGQLTLVTYGGRRFMLSSWQWTILELASAAVFVTLFGPVGLAYSCAIAAFPAIYLWLRPFNEKTVRLLKDITRTQFLTPIFGITVLLSILNSIVHDLKLSIVSSFALLLICLFAPQKMRKYIFFYKKSCDHFERG